MSIPPQESGTKPINEDWLAVIIAFVIIFLAAIGLFGPNFIMVTF